MRKYVSVTALALALVAGLFSITRQAEAAPLSVPAATVNWSSAPPTPVGRRVIEVVDKIAPTAWHVGAAVNWIDRYTGSDLRLVSRCSGKAYRCVTVKSGKVGGSPIGWSKGSTITIDTGKAASKKYRGYYKNDRNRNWLLVHELGHQHSLGHSTGRNIMNNHVNRYKMVFTSGQRSTLRNR